MASLGLSGESRLLALDGGARGADGAAAPDGAPPPPDPGCLLERVAAVTLDAAAAAHLPAGTLVALIKVDAPPPPTVAPTHVPTVHSLC
jgi:hypothetical protein